MNQELFNRIYNAIPEFEDKTVVFVVVSLSVEDQLITINSHGYSLKELAETIIDCSDYQLEKRTLLTPNEAAEYGLNLSLKKMHNQIAEGKSDRAYMLSLYSKESLAGVSIRDKISRANFSESLLELTSSEE